jgi:long-chain acyl-CoA synthetase
MKGTVDVLSTVRAGLAAESRQDPDHAALIMAGSGATLTYAELTARSNSVGHLLRGYGLRREGVVALLLENHVRFLEVAWGAQRAGLYYTAVNWHLAPEEIVYIVNDCGARVLITSAAMSDKVAAIREKLPAIEVVVSVDGGVPGAVDYEQALARLPDEPLADACEGSELLYSSGTTGRPKAVRKPLPPPGEYLVNHDSAARVYRDRYGARAESVYLNPAPLYHSAPLSSCMTIHRLGGTVVVMESFDAERLLELIERYRVTISQFVPTMFVRMLKLAAAVRGRYDVSSLRCAIHASAPCPVSVKRQMIAWLGPILYEYYGGTESMGTTTIDSATWLERPGSVGRAEGFALHILDENGDELPAGRPGVVYFESARTFEYLNDAAKTRSITDERGWRTLGDVGYLDADGYLFLTDRATFMIISGGVNIYPQEIEDTLLGSPVVQDAAVFGVPDEEYGESVKAVVTLMPGVAPGPAVTEALLAHCAEHLAKYKWPRSFDFVDELPRDPNGKLYKRQLREKHWAGHTSRIM